MKIFDNFDLKSYNSYKLKSICKKAYFPENEKDIFYLYDKIKDFHLIGSGHNIILSKIFYDKSFVILDKNYSKTNIKDNFIIAESGASMLGLSTIALNNSLSGLEMFYDIPSSLGGAVVMNAGASGEEIKDLIVKVRFLDLKDMTFKELDNDKLDFKYRSSFFQKNTDKIILKVWLKLKPDNKANIKSKMLSIKQNRWLKQPRNYPSAGSVFKRPKGKFVGPMIDGLGLKGFTIGGAQISKKHSGFIINRNSATGQDILDLIKFIQKKVYDSEKIHLEIEQRII